MVITIDLEKAYVRLDWNFIRDMLNLYKSSPPTSDKAYLKLCFDHIHLCAVQWRYAGSVSTFEGY